MCGGGWFLNVNLVIGFGPNLGLALWPRAKPINTNTDTDTDVILEHSLLGFPNF